MDFYWAAQWVCCLVALRVASSAGAKAVLSAAAWDFEKAEKWVDSKDEQRAALMAPCWVGLWVDKWGDYWVESWVAWLAETKAALSASTKVEWSDF